MRKAFTLIELAIVLVIIGLLLGGGMGIFSMLVKRSKVIETKDNLQANIEAIISYATSNDKLPNYSNYKNILKTEKDSWGKDFVYYADANLLNDNSICERKTTNLIIKKCKDSTCSNVSQQIDNIAFVILSSGGNYNNQTSLDTSSNPNVIKIYEPGVKVDDNSSDFSRVEDYDDIVGWVTLNELRVKIGCQGSQIKIVNNELPYGYVNSDYNATIFADGGVPFSSGGKYKWCYEGDIPPGLNATPAYKSNNCIGDDESLWEQSDSFSISGIPSSQGTYNLKVYVRDDNDPSSNNDNIVSKSFVITINPQTASSSSNSGPTGAQVSFANNIDDFNTVENKNEAISVDSSTNILYLGGNTNSTRGCFWFPTSQKLKNKTMRAYFEFTFLSEDTSNDSRGKADGFTFALMSDKNDIDTCGWAGGGLGYGGIDKSLAIEYDVYPNNYYPVYDPSNNHIALDTDGNIKHISPNPSAEDEGRYIGHPATWLEDGKKHIARIEILPNYDKNCNQKKNGKYIKVKVWVDCKNCNDLTKDFNNISNFEYCIQLKKDLENVYFGFTEGTGGKTQDIKIENFGIGFY
ncbi:lectin-like domain-containing protein [Nitrosophilus kaiyonis]|uniref:prepilin-type N-terminal cleavage/methylation domain-containing protein n=1 Tax=Nitrosophilus kaiyonis TaxID=2930200 RepID=UPI00248FA2CF|nr:prepilin-type N-terminal cleavage/methylation domain-containing protein [Nitrosophilus kaiyonis]